MDLFDSECDRKGKEGHADAIDYIASTAKELDGLVFDTIAKRRGFGDIKWVIAPAFVEKLGASSSPKERVYAALLSSFPSWLSKGKKLEKDVAALSSRRRCHCHFKSQRRGPNQDARELAKYWKLMDTSRHLQEELDSSVANCKTQAAQAWDSWESQAWDSWESWE